MTQKLLMLDYDGVLNDHRTLSNGYCQLKEKCVKELCRILDECPDVNIIISSAWRYMMFGTSPAINERGMEYLLCLFGAPYNSIHGRIVGKTISDEEMCKKLGLIANDKELDYEFLKNNGCLLRREQILYSAKNSKFVVLDDLNLEMPELIKTNGNLGLTKSLANKVIERFNQL
jgi:hypothetical protein